VNPLQNALVRRVCLTVALALSAAFMSWRAHPSIYQQPVSDFSLLHAGARALIAGEDPYASVGPGRRHEAPHGIFYPLTAVLASVPFAWAPVPDALYSAAGAALFAWGITSRRLHYAWFAVLTPAFIYTVRMSQWSTFMVGAALLPPWGFLLACKPTVGAAMWLAFPSRRSLIGIALFGLASVVLWPTWPVSWLTEVSTPQHIRAPLTQWGGPMLLLGLMRWKRAEARLLVALACVPHTPELYESLALFLIPASALQGAMLALLNYGVVVARANSAPPTDYVSDMLLTGQWMVWLLYLPCLLMVLRRPNVWPHETRSEDRAVAPSPAKGALPDTGVDPDSSESNT
jgi:hypothetical protein